MKPLEPEEIAEIIVDKCEKELFMLSDDETDKFVDLICEAIRSERIRLKAEFLKMVPEDKEINLEDRNYLGVRYYEKSAWNACRAEILNRIGEL